MPQKSKSYWWKDRNGAWHYHKPGTAGAKDAVDTSTTKPKGVTGRPTLASAGYGPKPNKPPVKPTGSGGPVEAPTTLTPGSTVTTTPGSRTSATEGRIQSQVATGLTREQFMANRAAAAAKNPKIVMPGDENAKKEWQRGVPQGGFQKAPSRFNKPGAKKEKGFRGKEQYKGSWSKVNEASRAKRRGRNESNIPEGVTPTKPPKGATPSLGARGPGRGRAELETTAGSRKVYDKAASRLKRKRGYRP